MAQPPRIRQLRPQVRTLERHSTLQPETITTTRMTGRRLQRERAALFDQRPLCERCLKRTPRRVTVATQRDHTIPLWKGGRDVPENTQALCDGCHAEKSADEAIERARR